VGGGQGRQAAKQLLGMYRWEGGQGRQGSQTITRYVKVVMAKQLLDKYGIMDGRGVIGWRVYFIQNVFMTYSTFTIILIFNYLID